MVLCQAFFDDRLKVNPLLNICDYYSDFGGGCSFFNVQTILTTTDTIMVVQPLSGEGCGSCGLGVILAAIRIL